MNEELVASVEQFIVPYWFEEHFFQFNWESFPPAGIRLYARTPSIESDEFKRYKSVHDLDDLPGWLPVTASQVEQVYNFPDDSHTLYGFGLMHYAKSVIDNNETLTLVQGNGVPALLEDHAGWKFSAGTQQIEQETLSMAVLYMRGVYFGVLDPIVIITNQGIFDGNITVNQLLPQGTMLRGGAMYGMATYAEEIPPSVMNNTYTVDNRNIVLSFTIVSGIRTVTTQTEHNFVINDLIFDQTVIAGAYTNTYSRVVNVINDFTYQATTTASNASYLSSSSDTTEVYVALTTNTFQPGTTLMTLPPLPFESTNVEHVWLRPQRMNMIANPSFEDSA